VSPRRTAAPAARSGAAAGGSRRSVHPGRHDVPRLGRDARVVAERARAHSVERVDRRRSGAGTRGRRGSRTATPAERPPQVARSGSAEARSRSGCSRTVDDRPSGAAPAGEHHGSSGMPDPTQTGHGGRARRASRSRPRSAGAARAIGRNGKQAVDTIAWRSIDGEDDGLDCRPRARAAPRIEQGAPRVCSSSAIALDMKGCEIARLSPAPRKAADCAHCDDDPLRCAA